MGDNEQVTDEDEEIIQQNAATLTYAHARVVL